MAVASQRALDLSVICTNIRRISIHYAVSLRESEEFGFVFVRNLVVFEPAKRVSLRRMYRMYSCLCSVLHSAYVQRMFQ
jgi:hypothetical protein